MAEYKNATNFYQLLVNPGPCFPPGADMRNHKD